MKTIAAARRNSILPPKGLLIALAGQLPLALVSLPLRTSAVEIAAGMLLLRERGESYATYVRRVPRWLVSQFGS